MEDPRKCRDHSGDEQENVAMQIEFTRAGPELSAVRAN